MTALAIDRLTVRYGAVTAVDQVSLQVPIGTVTALLGPNGAGKSSTVEVVSGLRTADSGGVRVLGLDPHDPQVKARMGVMLQVGGLYPTARPLEWLRYLARLYPTSRDPDQVLADVGIDPATRTATRRLSGGEQQRVKLAAALLPDPEFLVLDEPTAGLDPLARRRLLDTIASRRAAGASILLTTHQLADVEEIADQVVVIGAGRVLASGSVAELTGTAEAIAFTAPGGLPLDSLRAALAGRPLVEEPSPGHYVVHSAPTPTLLAEVTGWCASQGVLATDVRAGRRTLEDILIEAARSRP